MKVKGIKFQTKTIAVMIMVAMCIISTVKQSEVTTFLGYNLENGVDRSTKVTGQ